MAAQPGVIPALMDTLAEAREDDQKEYRHVRAHTPISERMLRRYEGKENFPTGGEIDDLVSAYAKTISSKPSPFDLWDEALARAKAAEAKPTGLGRAAGEAAKPLRGSHVPKRQQRPKS